MKILLWIKRKKLLIGFMLIVIAALIYWLFFMNGTKTSGAKYTLSAATNGSIISSISGSGQVAAESQVDLKPQVSGKITSLQIKEGEQVKTGQTLAIIDNSDAVNNIRDAELNLEQAKLNLENILDPADNLSLTQAKDSYNQAVRDLNSLLKPAEQSDLDKAKNAVQEATRKLAQVKSDYESQQLSGEQEVEKAYNDAYNAVYDAVTNLHRYTEDMDDLQDDNNSNITYLYGIEADLGLGNQLVYNYTNDFNVAMKLLMDSNYQTISKPGDQTKIKDQLAEAAKFAKAVYQALGSTRILIKTMETRNENYYTDMLDKLSPIIDQDIKEVSNYLDTLDSTSRTLDQAIINAPANLQMAQDAITSAESNLEEQQNALEKLQEGPTAEDLATAREKVQEKLLAYQNLQTPDNDFEVKAQKIAITQKEIALARAKDTLADYSVKAPFDGKIATLDVRLGDTVSSGTTVATIISTEYLAEVDLNEVDVPQVKNDNKVTITLDAFPDDTLTGRVISVDSVGASDQGVVNYTAKISFDNIIDGVKPGMTVSATIITDVKQDILLVPSEAVKSDGETSYVEYFDPPPSNYDETTLTLSSASVPLTKEVTVGSSDDTNTEITGGLSEGDLVVSKTVNGTTGTAKSTASGSGSIRIPGITGGGGFAGGGPPG